MSKASGYVLWEGASLLDGAPIVVVATMSSNNAKTGIPGKRNMIQTWILRADIEPHTAISLDKDKSICGDCVHRPANQGSCYVTVFQAPLAIYRAYKRGNYSTDLDQFYIEAGGRPIRMGAYGDPAAAPTSLWSKLASVGSGHTGYTHQWQRPDFDNDLLNVVMASADTESQALALAKSKKRYFRVISPGASTLPREVECLSDSVDMKCADCLLCDGGTKGKSVYINVHGSKANSFNPDLIASV